MSGPRALLVTHEWRVLTRTATVRVTLALFGLAIVTASVLGIARVAQERTVRERLNARVAQQLSDGRTAAAATTTAVGAVPPAGPLHPDTVANERGMLALMPLSPLAVLAVGQSDVYPSYLKVTARTLDALVTGDQVEHPLLLATGQVDLAFIVLFAFPLLIFALTFDLTASERESGTLRLLLSQPIRLADVVTGKLLARAVLVGAPMLLLPFLLVIATQQVDPPTLARLLLWSTAVLLYGAVWLGIAVVVSARGGSAPANALRLVGIWLILAIVGPSVLNLLIAVVHPMPSRVEAAIQSRLATREASVQRSRPLDQFLQDHPTTADVGREGMRQFASLQATRDRTVAARLEEVESRFAAQLQRQRATAEWMSLLSPTMIAQLVLLDLAGTSSQRFEHWRQQTETFQRLWQAFFEPLVLDVSPLTAADYDAAPRYDYREESLQQVTTRVLPRLTLLAVAAGLLFWRGLLRYRRFDA